MYASLVCLIRKCSKTEFVMGMLTKFNYAVIFTFKCNLVVRLYCMCSTVIGSLSVLDVRYLNVFKLPLNISLLYIKLHQLWANKNFMNFRRFRVCVCFFFDTYVGDAPAHAATVARNYNTKV